jgi:DNA-binding transcriptional ArsR family regulator
VPAASLFHSLSDPGRLALLQHLAGEHRVVDSQEHLGVAQSTVSAHLACLRDCELVTSRPQGRATMFSLAAGPELMAVLGSGMLRYPEDAPSSLPGVPVLELIEVLRLTV